MLRALREEGTTVLMATHNMLEADASPRAFFSSRRAILSLTVHPKRW